MVLGELITDVEQELVRCARARSSLRRGDDHWTRIGEAVLPGLVRTLGRTEAHDGMGVLPQFRDVVVVDFGARPDEQIVIRDRIAMLAQHPVSLRREADDLVVHELDAVALVDRADLEGDVFLRPRPKG